MFFKNIIHRCTKSLSELKRLQENNSRADFFCAVKYVEDVVCISITK
jgi:hypothetical protein